MNWHASIGSGGVQGPPQTISVLANVLTFCMDCCVEDEPCRENKAWWPKEKIEIRKFGAECALNAPGRKPIREGGLISPVEQAVAMRHYIEGASGVRREGGSDASAPDPFHSAPAVPFPPLRYKTFPPVLPSPSPAPASAHRIVARVIVVGLAD